MRWFNIVLIVCSFIAGAVLLPVLSDMMPIHWNAMGQVDGYMPKNMAVWFMPVLMLAMAVLFQIIPTLDPKKKKYALFEHEWNIMKTGFIAFFTYLHFVILYISFHPGISILPLMFMGMGALFILIGNYMSKIRQNYFIGIKVPWTLASKDNWNKTHRFASWCFVLAGIVTLAEAYFIWQAPFVIFGSILLVIVLPIIYSFLLFKKKASWMKFIYAGIVFFMILIGGLRLLSGEDDWMCKDGQWVMHGHPSSPMPSSEPPCR